jgi:integrase
MAKKRAHGEGTIFQDKQGYWVAEVFLPSGKRKRKYAKSQKAVKDWLLAQREAIRDAVWVDADSVTVSQFLDRYINDVASHTLRPKTLEAYSYLIRLHINPEIGALKLSALMPAHVQKLYTDKLNSGLSHRTVKFIHSVLHKALKQAVRWGLVSRNVCDLVDAPSPKRHTPVTWSMDEVRQFSTMVKGHRFYPIYILAIATGMREGEILGLQMQDVNWTTGTIHVRHAVQYLAGKGVVLTEPKTDNAKRSIKVPVSALRVLREHVEGQNRNQGFVFATRNGTPISPRNLLRHFKQVLSGSGLPEIRFHDLRHTCATLHLMAGTHPKTVQELLGHSQITLTLDTYSHVLPPVHEEAAEKMNGLLTGL